MSVLDKLQSNINLFFKIVLKGQPGEDVCWVCGSSFSDLSAEFCSVCYTFKCPICGSCYCSLSEESKKVLDREMFSVGLWNPFHNPPKRKRRK